MLSGKDHLVVSPTHQTRYAVDGAVFLSSSNAILSV